MIQTPQRESDGAPPRRVVLLGASNIARSISTVVETAERIVGGPLELLIAAGHGRSYGLSSSFFGRRLPGIVPCGLWQDLAQRPRTDTAALVTDIGNDLMYDVLPRQIIDWVTECLDRLLAVEARVVMTLLPVGNLDGLSRGRYLLMRSLMFPHNRSDLSTIRARALELNELVERLGRSRGVALVRPRLNWYGLDPIHLRFSQWPTAWRTILAPWSRSKTLPEPAAGSLRRWFYLRALPPRERHLLGIRQGRSQPAGRLPGGTTVALY